MDYQAVFQRYELKYLMSRQQKNLVIDQMIPYMAPDKFGHTTIRNIYFDTDDYRLVRHSLEKPVYKEKLRIRSYQQVSWQDTVFVELKKKYHDVVYKRREQLTQLEVLEWIVNDTPFPYDTQIGREIDYFFTFYGTLRPKMFLSYEREAFYALDGSDFRITFDENILARQEDLSLSKDVWGENLIDKHMILMEIKSPGGIPLWMTHFLSQQKLFKTSFSKYGTAYQKMLTRQRTQRLGKRRFIA